MASAPDANIIAGLPPLRWRGYDAPPYSLVTFEVENNLAPRSVPYVDDEIHDNTGRKSYPMTARLYFVNTVGGGTVNGMRLFPDYWNIWRDLLDGEAGELEHPVLGPVRARVKNAKGEIRAEMRAGVIIDIAWTSTLEDPSTLNFLADLQIDHMALATAAGKAAYAVGVYYPAPTTARAVAPTEADIFNAVSAALSGAFGASRAAIAKINQVIGKVGTMINLVQALDSAPAWPALDLLTSLWASLNTVAGRLSKAVRAVASVVTAAPTTLDAFAIAKGNSLQDVMGLNLRALRAPIVPKGTTLVYYL